jgi:16S rRNA (uracil1498-N3)-methyltransferase
MLKRLLCPTLPTPEQPAALPESEARHAVQVLRLRDGDAVQAIDGRGGSARARLRVGAGKGVTLEFDATLPPETARASGEVVLELAVLKGEAMEWAVEKAVELGARQLVPVLSAHTVVQLDRKGPEAFRDRWQKIADQALKQCGRLERMEVALPTPLPELLMQPAARVWCDDAGRDQAPPLLDWLSQAPERLHVLVGPEGGWSAVERELLARSGQAVSLGPAVLRAETAALLAVGLAVAQFQLRGNLDKSRQKKES